jgi:hypothetical protein
MPVCHGNGPDHCCWIGGGRACEFLEENTVPGRRWACALFRELGSWDLVHTDPRYLASKAHRIMQESHPGYECGDYPDRIPGVIEVGGGCCYG